MFFLTYANGSRWDSLLLRRWGSVLVPQFLFCQRWTCSTSVLVMFWPDFLLPWCRRSEHSPWCTCRSRRVFWRPCGASWVCGGRRASVLLFQWCMTSPVQVFSEVNSPKPEAANSRHFPRVTAEGSMSFTMLLPVVHDQLCFTDIELVIQHLDDGVGAAQGTC